MLAKRHQPDPLNDSPDDLMTGVCGTCSAVVEVRRYECLQRAESRDGDWADQPSAECPACKARAQARRDTNPGIVAPPASGTRVYVRRKQHG